MFADPTADASLASAVYTSLGQSPAILPVSTHQNSAHGSLRVAPGPQQTLDRLRRFFDAHTFDTAGPYADLFAVLLSTSRHLVDVNSTLLRRLEVQEVQLERLNAEVVALCECTVQQQHEIRRLLSYFSRSNEGQQPGEGQSLSSSVSVPVEPQQEGTLSPLQMANVVLGAPHSSSGHHHHRHHRPSSSSHSSRVDDVERGRPSQLDRHETPNEVGGKTEPAKGKAPSQSSQAADHTGKDVLQTLAALKEELAAVQSEMRSAAQCVQNDVAQLHKAVAASAPQSSSANAASLPPTAVDEVRAIAKEEANRCYDEAVREWETVLHDLYSSQDSTTRTPSPPSSLASVEKPGETEAVTSAAHSPLVHAVQRLVHSLRAAPSVTRAPPPAQLSSDAFLAPVADDMAALTSQLNSVCGRLEVLEVYAPHRYAVAARPPALGVELEDLTPLSPPLHQPRSGEADAPPLSSSAAPSRGVRVARVYEGFAGDHAGLSEGDVIVAVFDEAIATRAELYAVLTELAREHRCRCQLLLEDALVDQFTAREAGEDGEHADGRPRRSSARTHMSPLVEAALREVAPLVPHVPTSGGDGLNHRRRAALRRALPRFVLELTVWRDGVLLDVTIVVPAVMALREGNTGECL